MIENTPPSPDDGPIDVVITWVDGADPEHLATRRRYQADVAVPLGANATNPHRWANNDEISFCLRSIEAFAPWVRRIFIVVNDKGPDLSGASLWLQDRVTVVGHAAIFDELPEALPTFNSLAIETVLWRIPDLAERFLYFNDDVFLTAPLAAGDVFHGMTPVLRGEWADYRAIVGRAGAAQDPAVFHHIMQVNGAATQGFGAGRLFAAAHVVHPLRRGVFAQMWQAQPDIWQANARYRFRDTAQFFPQGAHNHACLAQGAAVVSGAADHCHITSGQWNGLTPDQMARQLRASVTNQTKFLCVNDLPQIEARWPEVRAWLTAVTGGAMPGRRA